MLSNAYRLAKFRFATAENEQNLQNFAKNLIANFANPPQVVKKAAKKAEEPVDFLEERKALIETNAKAEAKAAAIASKAKSAVPNYVYSCLLVF